MTTTNLERAVDDTVRELKQIRDLAKDTVETGGSDEDAWRALEEIHAIVDNLLWPN
jgi:hypothetical protein